MNFINSLKLKGFLSFPPESEEITLGSLNVIIGPNGSGKSNLIESIELLHAIPSAFASAIRDGGGAREWLWKGDNTQSSASIEVNLTGPASGSELRYRLAFAAAGQRTEVIDEVLEDVEKKRSTAKDVFFYYRYQSGHPIINLREVKGKKATEKRVERYLERQSLLPDESVLSQRKDPDLYPELTWVGRNFSQIQMFREWGLGRYTEVRKPQPADLPSHILLPDARNLGLVLNQLEHTDRGPEFTRLLSVFLPRYHRFSTLIQGGTVQFYLHEQGLNSPIPATRLSDGTIRFMAILALLLSPDLPPLICIEEPELGLHPDAAVLLADLLVEASTRTQLIVTTHSDALVSALTEQADSVLICENRHGTVLKRIDPSKLSYWLEQYRLGEIWRIGELGGNP
ncbi:MULTISPECIES: AAA family ATPase [Pectobacterium]|uniref:AAA family ATPase n=1 Tax=Pectobacterium TaxID=122277 RepID=UPI0015E0059E|nr:MULTISPECIES: AAA family ATPase [Pectobacterium]MBA0188568.1 AAA family ATPase [Pectobacterium odoriferum]MCA6925554.1 AAA family ATPase [Pectobacterium versatile]MCH5082311.1 AAA family ATPase [Pectobacterium versatile]